MPPKKKPTTPPKATTGAKPTRTRKEAAAQNPWIAKVKQYAAENGQTYKQAMTVLSSKK